MCTLMAPKIREWPFFLTLEINRFQNSESYTRKSYKVLARTSDTDCMDQLIVFVLHMNFHCAFVHPNRMDCVHCFVRFTIDFNSDRNTVKVDTQSVHSRYTVDSYNTYNVSTYF